MRKFAIAILMLSLASACFAERTELDSGEWVDQYGDIHPNKYENQDIFAPWNDPLKRDDPFAPWNDPIQRDDVFAPWNAPISDPQETNRYLRDNGVRDSEYYWR